MTKTARVIKGVKPDQIPFDELFAGNEPVLMPGLTKDWPLVRASTQSPKKLMESLAGFYDKKPVVVYFGEAGTKGHFTYNETMTGFNYRAERRDLVEVLDRIHESFNEEEHPYYYMNSIMLDETFPGLSEQNSLTFNHSVFETYPHVNKIWIGTESRATAHYDIPKNIACCVAGRRRYTLFPPDQIGNLYPGPLSLTPGGQVVTVADLQNPDFKTFPRLKQALSKAIIADLEPGDALYYPSMWWHEVHAKDQFNVMINYWWIDSPRFMGDPMDIMMHAMLGLRDRPMAEKDAWRKLFDYYIFGNAEIPRAHLPEHAQGALAEMNESNARKLRAAIHRSLNR